MSTTDFPEIDLDDHDLVRSYADRPELIENAMAALGRIGFDGDEDDLYSELAASIENDIEDGYDDEDENALRELVEAGIVSIDRAAEVAEAMILAETADE